MNNFSLFSLFKYDHGHIHLFFHRSACAREPKRSLPGPNGPTQMDCLPTVQPLGFSRPQSPEEELQGSTQHHLLLLPLPSSFPTVWTEQSLEASNSAACNPFCSHWWAAQWSSVRMVWNPGDPHAILSPLSHTPLFTQAQGHLGLVGREEVQRDPQLGALPSSAPPTWAPRQMELASSTGMHPPSGSCFFP